GTGRVRRERGSCCDPRGRRDQDRERETDGTVHLQTSLVGPRGRTCERVTARHPPRDGGRSRLGGVPSLATGDDATHTPRGRSERETPGGGALPTALSAGDP